MLTTANRLETLDEMLPPDGSAPLSVRTLRWMFLTSRHRDRFRSLAARLLGSSSIHRP